MAEARVGIRAAAATMACGVVHRVMRALGRNGRALPGKVALALDGRVIRDLSSGQGRESVVITGTNGKTTTTHIIQQAVMDRDGTAAYDPSSTNMSQGIATTLCLDSWPLGRRRSEWAVIECDEGATKSVLPELEPSVMVVTNIYRDQVDRYPEWTTARDYIVRAARACPGTTLVLDADCQVTASIAELTDNPVVWFGVGCDVYGEGIADRDEDVACVGCGREVAFGHRTFAHLGDWSCPSCGRGRHIPDIEVTSVAGTNDTHCRMAVRVGGAEREVTANVRVGYDVYNAAAAVAGLIAMGFPTDDALSVLGSFRHAPHRFEVFDVGGTRVRLLLAKNTVGGNQLVNVLSSEPRKPDGLVLLLGAETMDGLSTEWVDGIRWERICDEETDVIIGGPREDDMRECLVRRGIGGAMASIGTDYARLADMLAKSGKSDVTVIANCSAIEGFRLALVRGGHRPVDIWSATAE